jgi:aminopeptidase N
VECLYGKEAGQEYLNGLKRNIGNRQPIVGPLGVNASGSGDMYDKGAIMLNTVRNLIGNDSLWFQMLRGLTREFGYKTTDTKEVVDYILEKSQKPELEAVFKQYLFHTAPPVLEYEESRKGKEITLRYRWVVQVEGFQMPVPLIDAAGQLLLMPSATEWNELKIKGSKKYELSFKEDLYYFLKRKIQPQ